MQNITNETIVDNQLATLKQFSDPVEFGQAVGNTIVTLLKGIESCDDPSSITMELCLKLGVKKTDSN